ncbi:hypothetical protein Vretifemale_10430 [Volvox reticuliferus]|uniref:Uncharacterized protein n=1 Tax=Volvox reticuliferus TaxID=1737510 RepID=A0A8J4FML5_9CHLO|nr:hypothetical protein Vretifemale_10430 [Volvox reticuliferus]
MSSGNTDSPVKPHAAEERSPGGWEPATTAALPPVTPPTPADASAGCTGAGAGAAGECARTRLKVPTFAPRAAGAAAAAMGTPHADCSLTMGDDRIIEEDLSTNGAVGRAELPVVAAGAPEKETAPAAAPGPPPPPPGAPPGNMGAMWKRKMAWRDWEGPGLPTTWTSNCVGFPSAWLACNT